MYNCSSEVLYKCYIIIPQKEQKVDDLSVVTLPNYEDMRL